MLEHILIIVGITAGTVLAFSVYMWFKTVRKVSAKSASVNDFTGKFERRRYRFHNGLECCQEQLSLEQNEEFSLLLEKVGLGDMAGFTIEKMNKALYSDKGMRDLFALALMNEDGSRLTPLQLGQVAKLKDEEVETVINDFFTLNPAKKAQFDFLRAAAVSAMIMEVKSSDGDSMTAKPAQ